MTVIGYGSEAWVLQKEEEDLLTPKTRRFAIYFPKKLTTDSLSTWLTDCISNSGLYKKYGSIPVSRAIIRDSKINMINI